MTWSPFSEIALYGVAYNIGNSSPYLGDVRRVMDFQHLFIRNPNYTQMIRDMDINMASIFHIITNDLPKQIDHLKNITASTSCQMNSTLDWLNAIETQYTYLDGYMKTSFFLKSGSNPEYLIDDFGARVAHDVLRDLGYMNPFIKNIYDSLTVLHNMMAQNPTQCFVNATNISALHSDLSGTSIQIDTCLARIQSIYAIHKTLNRLIRADSAFSIIRPWIGDLLDPDYAR